VSELFAGLAPDGSTRFIAEVARGRSCDCRCPECDSPLIAKQGSLKVWHFAHEGGQERPECEVGAANLLRRLAIEVLRARSRLEIPPWRVTVEVRLGMFRDVEDVELASEPVAPWMWQDAPPRHASVARSRLSDGVPIELHVEVGSRSGPTVDPEAAAISFWLNIPGIEHLQTRASAIEQIEQGGQWVWLQRPDPTGVAARAKARLQAKLEAKERQRAEIAERLAAEAADRIARATEERRLAELHSQHEAEQRGLRRAQLRAELIPGLVPGYAGEGSFMLYALKPRANATAPGQHLAWLVYPLEDGATALKPWPQDIRHDVPATVGLWDEALGLYRSALAHVFLYLRQQPVSVRNTSDIDQLAEWVAELSSGGGYEGDSRDKQHQRSDQRNP
jgi:hypothetical protein